MYPNNIYVKNHAAVAAYNRPDINVDLDMYDADHGLKYDALARAQYKHWRSVVTGAPLMSKKDEDLLGL